MKNGFDLENNFCVCTGNAGWTVLYRMVVLNKILAFISTELLRKSWAIWVADMFEKEQNCCNHTETWCKSFFIMAEKVPHVKGFSIQSFNTTVPERVLWELCFWDTLAFPSHTFSSSLLPSSSSISVNSQYLFFLIFEFQKGKVVSRALPDTKDPDQGRISQRVQRSGIQPYFKICSDDVQNWMF